MESVEGIKEAQTSNQILNIIKKRFSPRSFKAESLTSAEIETLIEAASWAPSSMNEQPWRFVVALRNDTERFKKLWNYLMPGNKVWAEKAGALVLILGKKNFENGNANSSAVHDVGLASMNLLLQAVDMDIYGHLMGGFTRQKVIDDLHLAEKDLEPVTILALGRLDKPELLEEPFYSRELTPRTRHQPEKIMLDLL